MDKTLARCLPRRLAPFDSGRSYVASASARQLRMSSSSVPVIETVLQVLALGCASADAPCRLRILVAAIGRFRMPVPEHHWARLQDVDVFPNWRGHGYGTAMLVAMLRLLASEGATMVVVGADEDDWPLTWYRRHGFCDVARVRKKD